MAGISAWFNFVSKEEREKKDAEYRAKMFPLGPEQQQLQQRLLDKIIRSIPSPSEKMYHFLLAKDAVMQCGLNADNTALKAWFCGSLAKKLTPMERYWILAFVCCEADAATLEDCPSQAIIEKKAAALADTPWLHEWENARVKGRKILF